MEERDDVESETKSVVRFSDIDEVHQDGYRSVKNEYDDGGSKHWLQK